MRIRVTSALCLLLSILSCHQTPLRTNTVTMAWESFPLSLDPRMGQDQASQRLLSLTHQGLLKRNPQLELVPDACLDWRWEQAYTELSFDFPDEPKARKMGPAWFRFATIRATTVRDATIRATTVRATTENAVMDRALLAADALDSIEALRDPALSSPKAGPFKEEIESLSLEHLKEMDRLHIRLKASNPGFPSNLGRGSLGISPSGMRGSRLPGSGPYQIQEVVPEQRILLEAKLGHRDFAGHSGVPQNLELRLLPDANSRLLALRHGTVQAALNNLPPDLLRPGQGFEIHRGPGANMDYVIFQCEQGPLQDARVRLALALAVDRHALMEGLMGGMAQEAWGYFPPSLPQGIDVRQSLSIPASLAERITRSESLLNAAGFPPGRKGIRFQVRLSTSPDAGVRLRALALQEQWRRIGVEVKLLNREFGTLFSEISGGKFEMAMLRWTGASDPEMLVRIFHSRMVPPSGFNRGRFRDAAVDRLLDESHRATTPELRLAKLREAQIRIVEAAPCVFLWWPDQLAALAPGLEIDLNGVGDFTGIWRSTKEPLQKH